MKYKIVADSSGNITELAGVDFASVPLHVIVGGRDFADDENLDVSQMQAALECRGVKSSTACPAPDDWLRAFGEADVVFAVTITGTLSGSYAAACAAKDIYLEEHPERQVYVFNSLSTGPEVVLFAEYIRDGISKNILPALIAEGLEDYSKRTKEFFALGSLNNFANNGRINPLLAKGIGILGVRILGKCSDTGNLQPLGKCRGDAKAVSWLISRVKEEGFKGGKIILSHTFNEEGAMQVRAAVLAAFPGCDFRIMPNRGLCSYYAEPMSLVLGFETD